MKQFANGTEVNKSLVWKYVGRILLQILAFLSVFLWGIYIFSSILTYWVGFTFLFTTSYKMDAVASAFMIYMFLCWPIFLVSALIILISVIYFLRSKKNYPKEERKLYHKFIAKAMIVPVCTIVVIGSILLATFYYFSSTYSGAKILAAFLPWESVPNAVLLEETLEMEEVAIIVKNGEPIYVSKYMEPTEDLSFLKDIYYNNPGRSADFVAYMMDGADEYEFLDERGIYVFSLLVKDEFIAMDSSLDMLKETSYPMAIYRRLRKQ